jgi:transposase InsO family protein
VKDLLAMRFEFVSLARQPDANIRLLCRRFNISPTVGYKWLERFETGGATALANRSRRPRQSPQRTDLALETLVVDLRRQHPAWGARKLRARLAALGHAGLPATSTITGILHRHELIPPEQTAAATPWQRFERPAPNQLWQIDFKGHFALRAGRCHPLCALDDHSRYNLLLCACADQKELTVQGHLRGAFRIYGLPDRILWDNGAPWGSAGEEYTGLDAWLLRLGVRVSHGRAYHPQTQGKEERFHRTLQAEVLVRGGWSDCAHVQRDFDGWRPIYNGQRPHEALSMEVPASRYQPSGRAYAEALPSIEYAPGVAVRRVDEEGWISYRGRLWRAGRAFAGQPVGVRPSNTDGVFDVLFLTEVLKQIDLRSLNAKPLSRPALPP